MVTKKSDKKTAGAATKTKKTDKKTHKSFRLEKPIRHGSQTKLTGAFRLFKDSVSFARQYWKVLGGIALVYFLLSVVLVGFSSNADTAELKKELDELTSGSLDELGLGVVLFADILSSSGVATTEGGSAYQTMLVITVSLAVIWALRQLMAGQKVSTRDAFYKGMYPLVPAALVLLVIGLQLIPLILGSFLYNTMFTYGLAVTVAEQFVWGVLIFLLVLLSLYFITSSIFAFYIVTLADMQPMRALRSARELVRHRRWAVMRRLLFLPLALLVIGAVITIPIIWIWAPLAPWIFLLVSMAGLVFAHVYIYSLYRELL